jgi:hypothetical protein
MQNISLIDGPRCLPDKILFSFNFEYHVRSYCNHIFKVVNMMKEKRQWNNRSRATE